MSNFFLIKLVVIENYQIGASSLKWQKIGQLENPDLSNKLEEIS